MPRLSKPREAAATPEQLFDAEIRERFGDRLRQAMQRRGASQAELAKAAGVSRAAVNHWLQGKDFPRLATLYRVAKEYKLSIDYILFGSIYSAEALDLARQISALPDSERAALKRIFGSSPDTR